VLYVTVALWPKSAMLLGFALIACLAYKWNHLTASGVSGAFVLGVLCTWIFGIAGLVPLLLFFVSSNVIGKIRTHIQKEERNFIEKKNGRKISFRYLQMDLWRPWQQWFLRFRIRVSG
jgi:uncharacterized membrane protein